MRFITYSQDGKSTCLGTVISVNMALNLTELFRSEDGSEQPPRNVQDLIDLGDGAVDKVREFLAVNTWSKQFLTKLEEVRLLAPIPRPRRNIVCVGRNYREHIIEGNRAAGRDPNDFPKAIEFFTKATHTVVGPGASVERHARHTRLLDYEIELAIVIGKRGRDIPRERALDYVFGYTIVNDITGRDLQKRHGQWFKGKSLDSSCPMGPWLVHISAVANAQSLALELDVNGEPRQRANTSDMLFDVPAIVHELSAGMTLEPGDVIATGTPSGVGFAMTPMRCLEVGDEVRARITGLGELVNRIVE